MTRAVWDEIAANETRTGFIFGRALAERVEPLPRIGPTMRPAPMPACEECGNIGPFFCDCEPVERIRSERREG